MKEYKWMQTLQINNDFFFFFKELRQNLPEVKEVFSYQTLISSLCHG